jgi:hypothetical protein
MPYPVDPASLEGDELEQWYRRSPQEIEKERQAVAAQRYRDFFGTDPDGATRSDLDVPPSTPTAESGFAQTLPHKNVDPGFARPVPDNDIDPGFARPVPDSDIDPGFAWTPTSPNRWRSDRISDQSQIQPAGPIGSPLYAGPHLDNTGAGPTDGSYLVPVGNPYNPRLRREHERATGQPWPKTVDGRNYDVAHTRAIADGGSNTLDNIQPMHPDAHRAQHIEDGDAARWGRRASIARAFGGKVAPPTPRARVNGLGLFQIIPDITGILSGRIRTDTPTHMLYDLGGFPAPDDYPPPFA